jgi:multisubunit Na+/H+ antiporter MnhB subunit
MMIILYLLLIFIILAAVIAVESRNLLSSVISLGAVGLGLSLLFLILNAPELAVTQLVVEVLAIIILVRATIAKTAAEIYHGRERLAYGITMVFIFAVVFFAFSTFSGLNPFGYPDLKVSAKMIERALPETGALSVIAAIALDYRALDSLVAGMALFAAALGAMVILRNRGRKKKHEWDGANS